MKKLYLFIFISLIIISCSKDEQIVNPNNNRNKLIFSLEIVSVYYDPVKVGDGASLICQIDVNNNLYIYSKYFKNIHTFEFYYTLNNQTSKSQTFIDSLNNLFIDYNFLDYPQQLPINYDSLGAPIIPSENYIISWRKNLNDTIKTLNDCCGYQMKDRIDPQKYHEFLNKLGNLLNIKLY